MGSTDSINPTVSVHPGGAYHGDIFPWERCGSAQTFLPMGASKDASTPKGGVTPLPSAYDQRRGSALVETEKGILLASSTGRYFRLPGGKPKKGESSIQAAIREFREETGLRAYDVRYLFTYSQSKVFLIRAKGTPRPMSEIHHLAYYPTGSDIRVSENTRRIIWRYHELHQRARSRPELPCAITTHSLHVQDR